MREFNFFSIIMFYEKEIEFVVLKSIIYVLFQKTRKYKGF